MARILYTWEIGAGYGHFARFLPLALKLRERGHEVLFALRDVTEADAFLAQRGFAVFQAPVWLHHVDGLREPSLSYAEMLFRLGYLSKPGLTGLARAWRELFALTKADMVVADHSPTALLAAKGTQVHRVMLGTGFFSPPRVTPMPGMRPWSEVPKLQLMESEREALQTVNYVLGRLGARPLGALMELFTVDEDFLCTVPELDHYHGRINTRYWGPLMSLHEGEALAWRDVGDVKRIFAYLRPHRDTETLLQTLKTLDCEALVFALGMPAASVERFETDKIRITTQPLKMSLIIERCDLCVCHAGHGTIAAMLLAGVPQLLIPIQLEQYVMARHVTAYGAGLFVDPQKPQPDYASLLHELLSNPIYRSRARKFAETYAAFNQTQQIVAMAARIEEILKNPLKGC